MAGTVAAYTECKKEVKESGFLALLQDMAAEAGDRTTAKYAARVLDRLGAPGRK